MTYHSRRPLDVLPHVIVHREAGYEDVYAPWCPRCGSDSDTKWITIGGPFVCPQAWCRRCDQDFTPTREEAHIAREPQRLRSRLAELRAEVRR